MRRTKIVCTLGPSSGTASVIDQMMAAGMNVARLNFSHGTHEFHRELFNLVRATARKLDRNVAILADLQGPKIRTGPLRGGHPVELVEGASIVLTSERVEGTAERVSTTYDPLPREVRAGDRIFIADGALELVVEGAAPPDVHCRVVRGGPLGERKGINLPGIAISAPSLTEKDLEDLAFALRLGVDYVAQSFVRSADDVRALKNRIAASGRPTPVVAKIERQEALRCLDELLDEADAIMVARGDLGVEVELHRVPQIQKTLIRVCNERGKPVITATQMLESMVYNIRPTRAEAADVANAIYDGTDAVMLSGETANGRFPVEAVRVMEQIAASADEAVAASPHREVLARLADRRGHSVEFNEAIGQAVVRMTQVMAFRHIVVLTQSGFSAEAMARYRPRTPITAITLSEETRRRCALVWGVEAVAATETRGIEEMQNEVDAVLLARGLAERGDPVIIVAGTPLGIGGRTNLVQLHRVGEQGEA